MPFRVQEPHQHRPRTKLIAAAVCTDASVHDSQVLDTVLRDAKVGGKTVWADSA